MTRESRILVVLGAVGVVGLVALVSIARQYQQMLPRAASANPGSVSPAGGARQVEAFLAVRRAMRAELERAGDAASEETLARLRAERDQALGRAGMRTAEYLAVAAAYEAWRQGRGPGGDLAPEFESRRRELLEADLGSFERVDF